MLPTFRLIRVDWPVLALYRHPPVRLKEETPGLAAQAKITPDAARKTALARVPDGVIASEEIDQTRLFPTRFFAGICDV